MLQDQGPGHIGQKPPKLLGPILVALGGNLASVAGDPADTLRTALGILATQGAVIRATSTFYHTPAFPAGNGPDYVNAAVRFEAEWSAAETLAVLHAIEAEMGRERIQRWGQRTLDLDLIAHGDLVLPEALTHAKWRNLPLEAQIARTPDELVLPHPRMQDRAFVLVPLADVAPEWVHPILGRSVQQLLDDLPQAQKDEVRALE